MEHETASDPRRPGGPLAPLLAGRSVHEVGRSDAPVAGAYEVVLVRGVLPVVEDYRAALQAWFAAVRRGGLLVVTAPHAFLRARSHSLPSPWNAEERRLYTAASLMAEVEEALEPNSYRVRLLLDDDGGYDYALPATAAPVGAGEVVLALERIAPPAWRLSTPAPPESRASPQAGAPFPFAPPRTRVETTHRPDVAGIVVLKLDHLGDFIIGAPACEALRARFPDARIDAVVGSWNADLARSLGVFDEVIVFDGFPPNSHEQPPDIRGAGSAFAGAVTGEYDLAVDLRTDGDTRFLLRRVRARLRAGLGSRAQDRGLDIALPLDPHPDWSTAWEARLGAREFSAQPGCRQGRYDIASPRLNPGGSALVWGPYRHLQPGEYAFEPFLEVEWGPPGLVRLDVALDAERVAEAVLAEGEPAPLRFTNPRDGARFEFRVWNVDGGELPPLRFHGGRLLKRGHGGDLHQSEQLLLLVDLIGRRAEAGGLAGGGSPP